ncbi:helix-turn-helix domain-containing protein [Puniceibacterium sediminis]|uniref:helix-turn-helix domain-containing protein n=1 Tax=Puniceibacterium sediminis TaxID=1608407 RepID=UPI000B77BD5D|nr:helix-turn-helix transcriptional regulator [Puniceibacterium sediminis]
MSGSLQKLKIEFGADKDVRRAIEALQACFDEYKKDGNSLKDLAELSGIDPSSLSKTINGKRPNANIKTLAKILRSMGARLNVECEKLTSVSAATSNSVHIPEISGHWVESAKMFADFSRSPQDRNVRKEGFTVKSKSVEQSNFVRQNA